MQEGDHIKIDADVINTYNSEGDLVTSIKAELAEGVALVQKDGVILAESDNSGYTTEGCIKNKWVALGLNIATDGLVCAPFGAATGGVGGFVCGAGVVTGVPAITC